MKPRLCQQQATTDYGMFRRNQINRLTPSSDKKTPARKDLIRSMQKHGFLKVKPIVCYLNTDGTVTVLDGHNRLEVAEYLGLPVEFIAYGRDGNEIDPTLDQTATKTWTLDDMAKGYAKKGNEHYLELIDFHERSGISVKQAASMLSGELAASNNVNPKIKAGEFRIKDHVHPEVVADMADTIGQFVTWSKNAPLIAALSRSYMTPGFSPKRLKEKVLRHHEHLEKQRSADGYMAMLERIYNIHMSQNRFYLVTEADKASRERSAA